MHLLNALRPSVRPSRVCNNCECEQPQPTEQRAPQRLTKKRVTNHSVWYDKWQAINTILQNSTLLYLLGTISVVTP